MRAYHAECVCSICQTKVIVLHIWECSYSNGISINSTPRGDNQEYIESLELSDSPGSPSLQALSENAWNNIKVDEENE